MFLATTALSEFWDNDEEILFLGAWCLQHDQRSELEGLKYRVMPSPWDDRNRFSDSPLYLDKCGERMLQRLTDYLNSIHGLSKPQRYWRILLGPWLLHALHVTYDRYVHLTEAFNLYPDIQTIVLDPQSFRVSRDTKEFVELALNDPFNLQIFSQLLQGLGYAFPAKAFCSGWPETVDELEKAWWRRIAKRLAKHGVSRASHIICCLRGRAWQVGFSELGCSQSATWNLAWRSGMRVLPLEEKSDWSFSIGDPCFDDRRQNLARLPGSDEFEHVFIDSLPQNFPVLYLEGFREAREKTLRKAGRTPKVFASAASWYANEPFKFLTAEAIERGTRLITVQLGSGYGIFRFAAPELHETRVGDSFMVWGWAGTESGNCKNLPSPKLSSVLTRRPIKPVDRKTERILFVSTAHLRYLVRFHSCPIGIQDHLYFQWQLRFLTAIPDHVRRALLFRAYPKDYEHATHEQISTRFPDIQWDTTSAFLRQLQDSRLAVIDHSGTTFLEALSLGVPTILFWDTHWTEVRDEAEPYFEDLRKVGILWDSPEAAAKKVAESYDDPWSWWDSQAVQAVRRRFVARYAFAREDWVDCWVKALEEEVAFSQAR